MRVAYLGDENSHTFSACGRFVREADFVGCKTVRAAADFTENGDCEYCVLPAENSVEGSVTATADVLLEKELFIRAETILPIHQHLVAVKGAELADISIVYSHPQALAQCREWLEKHLPKADQIAVNSTSRALELLNTSETAAVAATQKSGQAILAADIEDYANNATRFVLLSKERGVSGSRASVIFAATNRPGGLLKVLKIFESSRMNMTYIQSRPSRMRLGDYIFFVDFTLPDKDTDRALDRLLTSLEENTDFYKFLGRYDDINRLEAGNSLWD